ncbi:tyrosine-type recombinase/integrase [Marinomonas mediterranea]|uniref:tyrosine-type recombinase/integrase n=1 Tax=Marinomonas mediterranea TaxID=119864 RepID=UPI002349C246|nr:tyrosine-type recombinase/integrase [Marinomonas mediterranea]WCN09974.1 tyrosine-type recombinase/integrase [Marinomonas mediterranea]
MKRKRRNANHPPKGSSIKVSPIRSLDSIRQIKTLLQDQSRNLALFTLGINTAYRANELLKLSVGQVMHLQAGDTLDLKQSKNSEYRLTVINHITETALQNWLACHPKKHDPKAPLFLSQRSRKALTVAAVNRLVKLWCKEARLPENYGSHTLRKTWGYHQRIQNKASVAILMRAFGHATEAQTLDYLCILPDEIRDLYLTLEL